MAKNGKTERAQYLEAHSEALSRPAGYIPEPGDDLDLEKFPLAVAEFLMTIAPICWDIVEENSFSPAPEWRRWAKGYMRRHPRGE